MSDDLIRRSDAIKALDANFTIKGKENMQTVLNYLELVRTRIEGAPTIEICFCRECKWEWTQKCPPHRMGLIHDESDYCSYGIRKGADDE